MQYGTSLQVTNSASFPARVTKYHIGEEVLVPNPSDEWRVCKAKIIQVMPPKSKSVSPTPRFCINGVNLIVSFSLPAKRNTCLRSA